MSKSTLEKFPVQRVGLHNITVDHELQSRVEMNVEHARALSEVRAEGREFSMPVVLFFDDATYWLADGFHRHWAATAFGDVDILAEVRTGTKRDAMVYSAGANQQFSLKRTREDIKKAAWMLFGVEEWWVKSNVVVAEHVGTSTGTIKKFKTMYSAEMGVELPDFIVQADGSSIHHKAKRQRDSFGNFLPRVSQCKNGRMTARVGGKCVSLGQHDRDAAVKRLAELVAEHHTSSSEQRITLETPNLLDYLQTRGLSFTALAHSATNRPGIYGFSGYGYCCTISQLGDKERLVQAVGRLVMLRELLRPGDQSARLVVVCYPDDVNPLMVKTANGVGVELLTPAQLADRVLGGMRQASDN